MQPRLEYLPEQGAQSFPKQQSPSHSLICHSPLHASFSKPLLCAWPWCGHRGNRHLPSDPSLGQAKPASMWPPQVKVLVTSYARLCDPMDGSPPGSSVPGILQVRILEWVAIPFFRGIFPPQGSNPGLPNCRQILYCSRHQRSPSGSHKPPLQLDPAQRPNSEGPGLVSVQPAHLFPEVSHMPRLLPRLFHPAEAPSFPPFLIHLPKPARTSSPKPDAGSSSPTLPAVANGGQTPPGL